MPKNNWTDEELDRLLADSLACDAHPDAAAVRSLKCELRRRGTPERGFSLWWLPALAGTAMTALLLYALTFVLDWACLAAMAGIGSCFVLSAWVLTLIGLKKFHLFQEARQLI